MVGEQLVTNGTLDGVEEQAPGRGLLAVEPLELEAVHEAGALVVEVGTEGHGLEVGNTLVGHVGGVGLRGFVLVVRAHNAILGRIEMLLEVVELEVPDLDATTVGYAPEVGDGQRRPKIRGMTCFARRFIRGNPLRKL